MTPGRNEPCPCGSGKKYKKCCLKNPSSPQKFEDMLNSFYALIKNVNSQLVRKANILPYSSASFTDAMDLAITSNALSLIKGFMRDNYYSITNALNIRNIIEHYAFVLMDEAGDITADQKELFNEQYKLIEYRFYNKIDFCDNGYSVNPQQLKENYDSACRAFETKGYSNQEVNTFSKTRAPFLCRGKFNFNEIIEKHLPQFLDAYIYLSTHIHPSIHYPFKDNECYTMIALLILRLVKDRYSTYKADSTPSLPFFEEELAVYGVQGSITIARQLYTIQYRQCEILLEIAELYEKKFEDAKYVPEFFKEVARILYDVNTDSQLGYTENPKLKFKVIAEMFACFSKMSLDIINGQSFYMLMYAHELFKQHEIENIECPQDIIDFAFVHYKQIHPNSTASKDTFLKAFKLANGFLIDEKAKRISLKSFVFDYLDSVLDSNLTTEKGANILNQYKVLYLESQGMSHGCGYLYFANHGAWMEDINVIVFLDIALNNILCKISLIWNLSAFLDETESEFSKLLEKKKNEMLELIKAKNEIISKSPRILKSF